MRKQYRFFLVKDDIGGKTSNDKSTNTNPQTLGAPFATKSNSEIVQNAQKGVEKILSDHITLKDIQAQKRANLASGLVNLTKDLKQVSALQNLQNIGDTLDSTTQQKQQTDPQQQKQNVSPFAQPTKTVAKIQEAEAPQERDEIKQLTPDKKFNDVTERNTGKGNQEQDNGQEPREHEATSSGSQLPQAQGQKQGQNQIGQVPQSTAATSSKPSSKGNGEKPLDLSAENGYGYKDYAKTGDPVIDQRNAAKVASARYKAQLQEQAEANEKVRETEKKAEEIEEAKNKAKADEFYDFRTKQIENWDPQKGDLNSLEEAKKQFEAQNAANPNIKTDENGLVAPLGPDGKPKESEGEKGKPGQGGSVIEAGQIAKNKDIDVQDYSGKTQDQAFKDKLRQVSGADANISLDNKPLDKNGLVAPVLDKPKSKLDSLSNAKKTLDEVKEKGIGGVAKDYAKDYAKELAKQAAQKALAAALSLVAPILPWVIIAMVAFIGFISIISAVTVQAYCQPIQNIRGIAEYALTGDVKNLGQVATDGTPIGFVGDITTSISTHSELYKILDQSVCKSVNPDYCSQTDATSIDNAPGSPIDTRCLDEQLKGKAPNENINFFKSAGKSQSIKSTPVQVGLIQDVIKVTKEAGVGSEVLGYALRVLATETGGTANAWTDDNKVAELGGCIGLIQICPLAGGQSAFIKLTSKAGLSGSWQERKAAIKADKVTQMKVIKEYYQEKLKNINSLKARIPAYNDYSQEFLLAVANLGFQCGPPFECLGGGNYLKTYGLAAEKNNRLINCTVAKYDIEQKSNLSFIEKLSTPAKIVEQIFGIGINVNATSSGIKSQILADELRTGIIRHNNIGFRTDAMWQADALGGTLEPNVVSFMLKYGPKYNLAFNALGPNTHDGKTDHYRGRAVDIELKPGGPNGTKKQFENLRDALIDAQNSGIKIRGLGMDSGLVGRFAQVGLPMHTKDSKNKDGFLVFGDTDTHLHISFLPADGTAVDNNQDIIKGIDTPITIAGGCAKPCEVKDGVSCNTDYIEDTINIDAPQGTVTTAP
jgi:hypothetical protein